MKQYKVPKVKITSTNLEIYFLNNFDNGNSLLGFKNKTPVIITNTGTHQFIRLLANLNQNTCVNDNMQLEGMLYATSGQQKPQIPLNNLNSLLNFRLPFFFL